jgi:hypothetical protein
MLKVLVEVSKAGLNIVLFSLMINGTLLNIYSILKTIPIYWRLMMIGWIIRDWTYIFIFCVFINWSWNSPFEVVLTLLTILFSIYFAETVSFITLLFLNSYSSNTRDTLKLTRIIKESLRELKEWSCSLKVINREVIKVYLIGRRMSLVWHHYRSGIYISEQTLFWRTLSWVFRWKQPYLLIMHCF